MSIDVICLLEEAVRALRAEREAEGRSEKARRLAITITELEKVIAYARVYAYAQETP